MAHTRRMVRNDALPWHGPTCPHCGGELDVEPISTDTGIRVAYNCTVHGLVSLADPFDEA